jgi:PTH1 family peptidyl-tRNA hydrolase
MKQLVVGLGNPGKQYDRTRHNIGFAAADLLAAKHGLVFKKNLKLHGDLAEGNICGKPCLLLKPQTYMNLSGESVAAAIRYFSVELPNILVLVDDVAIPMGQTRLRISSGSGGHNGLKSIEQLLQTNQYARLKLGVGDRDEGIDLANHVLGKFTQEEEKLIPALLGRAVDAVELFITNGLTRAMDYANKN